MPTRDELLIGLKALAEASDQERPFSDIETRYTVNPDGPTPPEPVRSYTFTIRVDVYEDSEATEGEVADWIDVALGEESDERDDVGVCDVTIIKGRT